MQDLIQQSGRRSVRNISIDKPKELVEEQSPVAPTNSEPTTNGMPPLPPRPQFGTIGGGRFSSGGGMTDRSKRWWWIGGGIVVALILLFVIGSLFRGASVTIVAREAAVSLDGTLTASLDPAPGIIGLELVTVEKEATRTVKATGTETIEHPASGTIVIYNDFDENTQKLIKNTRFQTPEGFVYRIQESVTVPGKQGTTPGSVEAKVFADAAGEEYNIGLADFTIPGFKEGGDLERYEKFYARSKTEMTGGFSGTVRVASKEDTTAAETAMQAELAAALPGEASASLPEGFVVIPESGRFSYETLPNTEGSDGNVVITVRGSGTLVAVNALDIARDTANDRIPGYTGEPVAFDDASLLSIALPESGFDPAASSTQLTVSGDTRLVWTFDLDELKTRLAGQSRSATAAIFGDYPGVERADVVIKPFWSRSLPETVDDIDVTVEKATR